MSGQFSPLHAPFPLRDLPLCDLPLRAHPLRSTRFSGRSAPFSAPLTLCPHDLLVINTNFSSYLAPFPRYSIQWVQNRYIWLPLLCLTPPTVGFVWDDLCEILPGCQQMASIWRRKTAENFNRLSRVLRARYRQTTDGRATTYSECEFTFAKNKSESLVPSFIGSWKTQSSHLYSSKPSSTQNV